MIGPIILAVVCVVITAAVIWADVTGFDPWPRLYGTDPRELVERAHERGQR